MGDADDKTRYVICYDVPDDKRRMKLAKCLDGFGDRIQYSVFEALLDKSLFDKLIGQIRTIIRLDEDKVTLYPLCRSCVGKRQTMGVDADKEKPGEEIAFIV